MSSTADHPKDEKVCGIKRSNPPPDWPSSVCSTRSFLSTMTTGTTTQEMQMSRHDGDPTSHTSCLHGKRLCQQVDVNRRCIPSVTAAMTKERNETSLVTNTQLHSTPINTKKIIFPITNQSSAFVLHSLTMQLLFQQMPSIVDKMKMFLLSTRITL